MDCKGIFTPPPPPPITSHLGTKNYPSFTKSRTCGGVKKKTFPSCAKYITEVGRPSVPECLDGSGFGISFIVTFPGISKTNFELTIVTGEGNWRAAERLQVTGHFWKPGPRMTVRSWYVMYKPPGYRGSPPIEENNKPFLFPLGV